MSAPLKPWRQVAVNIPPDQAQVWIKLWPVESAPVLAVWDFNSGTFTLSVLTVLGDQTLDIVLQAQDVFSWREQ